MNDDEVRRNTISSEIQLLERSNNELNKQLNILYKNIVVFSNYDKSRSPFRLLSKSKHSNETINLCGEVNRVKDSIEKNNDNIRKLKGELNLYPQNENEGWYTTDEDEDEDEY